jgi:AI-2 transport protein TqsA
MAQDNPTLPAAGFMLFVATFVVVVAGIKAAEAIMVPFLLAAFTATIAATPVFWLNNRGVPIALAVLLVILGMLAAATAVGALVGASVNQFMNNLPGYEARLEDMTTSTIDILTSFGIDVSASTIGNYFDPAIAMGMVGRTLSGFGGVLSNAFLILLTVIFILLEASSFPRKLRETLSDPQSQLPYFQRFTDTVNRYMAIKTTISLVTGGLIAGFLAVLGVDFPLLWGVVAFLLNYIPNIGSIIAAVPAVLMALIQLGLGSAVVVAFGFVGVNVLMGTFIEPRFMGRGLGLSTLVVFLSLVFWGWVLGPVGMLLSVPLTMTLKIALEANPDTYWLAVLLGPESDLPRAIETVEEEARDG